MKLLPSSSKVLKQRAGTVLKNAPPHSSAGSTVDSPGNHQDIQDWVGGRQSEIEGQIATHWHGTYFSNIKANGESVNKLTV